MIYKSNFMYMACIFVYIPFSFLPIQVDEVMLTLKQAFSTAAALQSAKTQIKLCEACPMHSLHKLCERIEGSSCVYLLIVLC